MYHILKEKIIDQEFSLDNVFDIIVDIKKYKDFVPFCSEVVLIKDNLLLDGNFTADLSLEVMGIKYTYQSHTKIEKTNNQITICTTGQPRGILKYLKSYWVITQNSDKTIIIEYQVDIDLDIKIPLLPIEKLLNVAANKIVESFEKRLYEINK